MVFRMAAHEGKVLKVVETELDLSAISSSPSAGAAAGAASAPLELYRVKYLERVDPREGVDALRRMKDVKASPKTKSDSSVLMLATIGQQTSIHVDPQLHKVLQCRKEDNRRHPSTNSGLLTMELGVKAANAAFKLGSRVLVHATMLGHIVGFGSGLYVLAEAPFFTRKVYKLNRQKKFDQITEEEYKRGVVKQTFTSAGTVMGVSAGAIIGQVLIPVPVVGAAVGGILGSIGGNRIGSLEGWAAAKLVKDARLPTLPTIVSYEFSSLPLDDLQT